jgi:hypothetical protein
MAYGDDDVCDCTATYCVRCLLCEAHCACEPMPAPVVAYSPRMQKLIDRLTELWRKKLAESRHRYLTPTVKTKGKR